MLLMKDYIKKLIANDLIKYHVFDKTVVNQEILKVKPLNEKGLLVISHGEKPIAYISEERMDVEGITPIIVNDCHRAIEILERILQIRSERS